jgi:hypothetical protein
LLHAVRWSLDFDHVVYVTTTKFLRKFEVTYLISIKLVWAVNAYRPNRAKDNSTFQNLWSSDLLVIQCASSHQIHDWSLGLAYHFYKVQQIWMISNGLDSLKFFRYSLTIMHRFMMTRDKTGHWCLNQKRVCCSSLDRYSLLHSKLFMHSLLLKSSVSLKCW